MARMTLREELKKMQAQMEEEFDFKDRHGLGPQVLENRSRGGPNNHGGWLEHYSIYSNAQRSRRVGSMKRTS